MGYESRVVIVERNEVELPLDNSVVFGDEIARFELGKMGAWRNNGVAFTDVFKTPIDFDLYNMSESDPNEVHGENWWREDCYGEHCKWASIDDVMDWLDGSGAPNDYRRARLFYGFLKELKARCGEYRQLCLVHYGY